mgnify:CR=1 FL=1
MPHSQILAAAGFTKDALTGGSLSVKTPVDGSEIACIPMHSLTDAEAQIAKAKAAFKSWRLVPAPRRGELVRLLGEELRREKENLGRLVTLMLPSANGSTSASSPTSTESTSPQ